MNRDSTIAARFAAGETRGRLAAEFGMTPRSISRICARQGVRFDRQRLRHYARLGGRKPLPIPAEDARHYSYLRKTMGAAFARQAFGIEA